MADRNATATIGSLCDHAQHVITLCHCDSPHIQSLLASFRAACLREISRNNEYSRGPNPNRGGKNYNNKDYEEYDEEEEYEPRCTPDDPRYRTVPCKYWASGNCSRGEKCTFAHEKSQKGTSNSS